MEVAMWDGESAVTSEWVAGRRVLSEVVWECACSYA